VKDRSWIFLLSGMALGVGQTLIVLAVLR